MTSVILGACYLAFRPVLGAEFVNWDGDRNFTNDHALWGMNPRGYHLTNLLLHGLNSVLLLRLMLRLLGRTPRHVWAAGAATLLFAVHPLRVETVARITERRALLAFGFFVLALLAYLAARDPRAHPSTTPRRARTLFWVSVVAFLFSLLSKGLAITMPVLLLLLDYYPLRRRGLVALAIEKWPFLVSAIAVGYLARLAQQEGDAVRALAEHSLLSRCAQAAYGALFYLAKTVVPTDLCALHPLEHALDWTTGGFLLSLVGALLLSLFACFLRRRQPWFGATWAAYLIILAPVSGLGQSGPQLVAERDSYLASLPIAVLIAAGLAVGFARLRSRWVLGTAWFAGLTLVATTLGWLSLQQSKVWANSITLWTRVAEIHPRSIQARYGLGTALRARDRHADAAREFLECVTLDPRHGTATYLLGLCRLQTNEMANALAAFEKALELRTDGYWLWQPSAAELIYCTALANHWLLRHSDTVARCQEVLAVDPNYEPVFALLADNLVLLKRRADALEIVRRGLRVNPDNTELQRRRAELEGQQKDGGRRDGGQNKGGR